MKTREPEQLLLWPEMPRAHVSPRLAWHLRWWRYRADDGLWWETWQEKRRALAPVEVRSPLLN